MTSILEFLEKNYLLFDLITLFLVLSLIGYFVSRKKEKENVFKIDKKKENINDLSSLQSQINTNISLQELVKENKNTSNNKSNNL